MNWAVNSTIVAIPLALIAGCSDNTAEASRAKALPPFNTANEIRAGRQEEAIALYTEAITADPQFAEAYHNRGLSYAEMYDFERAEADLAKVKQLGLDSKKLEEAIAIAKDRKGTGKVERIVLAYLCLLVERFPSGHRLELETRVR